MCSDILELSEMDLKNILKQRMYQGAVKTRNGSTFIGFAAKVHTIQDVANCYKQLKYRYMEAAHIMCAYRIMDPDVAHMTDCIDGGELEAGRRLLQLLLDESGENIAVFVIRFHKGPNIGPVRFQYIVDTAKAAISNVPAQLSGYIRQGVNDGYAQFKKAPLSSIRGSAANVHRAHGASTAARALNFGRAAQGPEPARRHPMRSVDV